MRYPFNEGIGESPEYVAFRLLEIVMAAEQKSFAAGLDRKWLLDAYGECLATVNGIAHKPPMKISPEAAARFAGKLPT